MDYDHDVIVVGAGPAGLSAAIRARWVKRYKSVACSTLVIENSSPGGLAAWHGCMFTGPSWKLEPGDILTRLLRDMRRLYIPVHRSCVTRMELDGDIKTVHTADGRSFRALAVIIAAGIKVLVNEKDYLGKGLDVTSMGYEYIVDQLKKFLAKPAREKLVITGSCGLHALIPLARELNTTGRQLLFVMEDPGRDSRDVLHARIEAFLGHNRLEALRVRTAGGTKDIACSRVLLDFNSYELSPVRRCTMEGLRPSRFVKVDQDMQTGLPGVFAAGDVTAGGYNSFSRAVGQGIAAGLSAYRHVFCRKFGSEPPLFAYRPSDIVLSVDFRELPVLRATLKPRALARAGEIRRQLGSQWAWLCEALDGAMSIAELSREHRVPVAELQSVLVRLVEKKLITLHAGS